MAFDGGNMWVVNGGGNTVKQFVAASGVVASTYAVGNNPFGIAFHGTFVWVTP